MSAFCLFLSLSLTHTHAHTHIHTHTHTHTHAVCVCVCARAFAKMEEENGLSPLSPLQIYVCVCLSVKMADNITFKLILMFLLCYLKGTRSCLGDVFYNGPDSSCMQGTFDVFANLKLWPAERGLGRWIDCRTGCFRWQYLRSSA